ncbi:MAG: ABC transporter ATP-binding protein [Deltaproteobacteria bacterium]|jgi:branched-chain amino acid transport system ATP-binding protein|nr:MAG: ABC transporter ATP-binding protein [Deltaproteobacteria bacterium]
MLEVNDIHVYYDTIHALKGVSFSIETGELVTLLGANGAGKTTTLKTLSGLLRPKRGSIELEGAMLENIEAHEIVRRGVAHAPEGRRVFPRFTVLENLKIGGYTRDKRALGAELDFVFQMFPRLKERQKQYAGTLSGGEQQMLAIGRALMAKPKLLLLDEPSMGLAPKIVEQILETIRTINKAGVTVLLVEQNAVMALAISHRGYVLETGEVILKGTSSELAGNDLVRQAYLGG